VPDESNNQGPTNITVNNISAQRQNVGDMQVQRLNVATGEEKTGETDLLGEVRNAINIQTNTLTSILGKILSSANTQNTSNGDATRSFAVLNEILNTNKQLVSVTRTTQSGGDGGGGGSLSDSVVQARLASTARDYIIRIFDEPLELVRTKAEKERQIDRQKHASSSAEKQKHIANIAKLDNTIEKITESMEKTQTSMYGIFSQGLHDQFRGNLVSMIESVQSVTSNLMNFTNVTREVSEKFNTSTSIATSGVANLADVLTDIAPGFRRDGDNLRDTFELVRNSLNNNMISPVGVIGTNLMEVSENIRQARNSIRAGGASAIERMGYEESNEAIVNLLDLERQSSVTADLRNTTTQQNIGRQLRLAQLIASNTGRTAAEVIKSNSAKESELRGLSAAGGLTASDQTAFSRAQKILEGRNLTGMSDLLQQVGMAGGSTTAFLSQNESARTDLAIMGQLGTLNQLMSTVRGSSGISDIDLANKLMAINKQFGNNRYTGVAGAMKISGFGRGLASQGNYSADFVPVKPDANQALFNDFKDIISNIVPLGEGKLALAIGANTVALGINTLALMGGVGGLGVLFKKFGRGSRALGSTALGWGSKAIGLGGTALGATGLTAVGTRIAGSRFGLGSRALGSKALGLGGAALGATGLTAAGNSLLSLGKPAATAAVTTAATAAATTAATTTAKVVGASTPAATAVAGRLAATSILKAIPFIGAAVGLGTAAVDVYNGDYTGAALSAGAGLSGMVPFVGTAGSAGLSAAYIAHKMGAFDTGELVTPNPVGAFNTGELGDPNQLITGPEASWQQTTTSNKTVRTNSEQLLVDLATIMNSLVELGTEDITIQKTIAENTGKLRVGGSSGSWGNNKTPTEPATHSQ
jgi:hypothetical protein